MTITLYKYHDPTVDTDYAKKLDVVGVVDDYISCIFTRSWTGAGEWSVVMPKTSNNIADFYDADFIRIHAKGCGLINKASVVINEQENTITFSGVEMKGLAYLRVSDPRVFSSATQFISGAAGNVKTTLMSYNLAVPPYNGTVSQERRNRRIPSGAILNDEEFVAGEDIKYQPVYENLGDAMETISKTYDNGWQARVAYVNFTNTQRTKNLLVRQSEAYPSSTSYNVLTGSYINSSGKAVESPGDAYTLYIPVVPGEEYYWYGINSTAKSGNKRLHGYQFMNENSWVQQIGLASSVAAGAAYEVHVTIPSGVYFIRCSFMEADQNVMLEKAPKTSYTVPWIISYERGEMIAWTMGMEGLDCTAERSYSETRPAGERLILNYNLDTLYSSSLEVVKHQPNVAYVAGQGQRQDRAIAVVDQDESVLLDRYETLVDARDIVDTNDLPVRGVEYLARYGSKLSYVLEASQYMISKYPWEPESPLVRQSSTGMHVPSDRNLEIGNYGTIIDEEMGVEQDFQITAVTEVYDCEGFRLQVELGYDSRNLDGTLDILSAQTQSLLKADTVSGSNTADYTFTIQKGDSPQLRLLPDLVSGETVKDGCVLLASTECLRLQARDNMDTGTQKREIVLYNKTGQSSIANALYLCDIDSNNNYTYYPLIHSGNISNNLEISSGSIGTQNGTVYTWVGNIYTSNGDIFTSQGDLYTSNGKITASGQVKGGSLYTTGALTAGSASIDTTLDAYSITLDSSLSAASATLTGALSANSASITNGVSCKTLTATNNISGLNVSASNKVTCYDIDVTNKVSTKTVHVEDGYYPMFELKPTANSVTKVQRVEGSLYGEIGLQAWADSTGNDRTILSVYDPVEHSAVDGRIAMRQCVGGTWTTYNMLHTGNIASYATPLSPSSVSPITWDTNYVNTASGKTSYVCYKLGKIRIFRFKIVLSAALTATTTIGTVSSGNRPNTTYYGTINTLSDATTDVRTIAFATGGNISMYKNTKATTYYGTVVYFTS